ncbi:MAG TPA: PEP-CTERM sorting domain-containing protein [Pirellulales bacterium]|jgi:hypothetical protein|nr:PEP-CTERM sorting domain-containing protein [Pirellulales bacterium]
MSLPASILLCGSSFSAARPSARLGKRRVFLTALALFAALLGIAGSAHATLESFNFSYGPDTIPEGYSLVGSLPQFDPSLGTLTEVDLTLSSTTSAGIIQFQNLAVVPTTGMLGIGATVMVYGPSSLTATAVPLQEAPFSVTSNINPPDTYTGLDAFTLSGGSGSDSDTASLYSGFSGYVGLGTFPVHGSSSLATLLTTDGGYGPTAPSAGSTSGEVTVTYTYTPVPEPGSVVLLGLGAAGLFWAARRRGKK